MDSIIERCYDPVQKFNSTIYRPRRYLLQSCQSEKPMSLQILQNRALRIIYSKKDWPGTHEALSQNRLLTIDNRRALSLLKFAHNRSDCTNMLLSPLRRNLRSASKIYLNFTRPGTTKYAKCSIYKNISMWNSLDEEPKSHTIQIFFF